MRTMTLCFAFVLLCASQGQAQSGAGAQKPAAQTPAPSTAAPVEQPKPPPPVEPPFSYEPEDRRDPFASLLNRGSDNRSNTSNRPPGLGGLTIAEATVKGIVRDKGGFIAMIQAPDSKTYIVRPGDRLFDGSVKSIGADKVVFSQDVTDPLSLVKQREIPKAVRTTDVRGGN